MGIRLGMDECEQGREACFVWEDAKKLKDTYDKKNPTGRQLPRPTEVQMSRQEMTAARRFPAKPADVPPTGKSHSKPNIDFGPQPTSAKLLVTPSSISVGPANNTKSHSPPTNKPPKFGPPKPGAGSTKTIPPPATSSCQPL